VSAVALPALSLVFFLVVWQIAASSGIWNETFVPYPSTVWDAFVTVSTTHDGTRGYQGFLLWDHLYMTLRRVLAGVLVGVALGLVLGLAMGTVQWVRRVLEPWLTFLRALPPLAYFFLLVIWLGIDEAPKVTLLALAALPPTTVATTAAPDESPSAQASPEAQGAAVTSLRTRGAGPMPHDFTVPRSCACCSLEAEQLTRSINESNALDHQLAGKLTLTRCGVQNNHVRGSLAGRHSGHPRVVYS
jgi:hypothetical protein